MMPKTAHSTALITLAVVAAAGIAGAQGCAQTSGAPFHVYDSPLLAGQMEARYPRSRSFNPFQGDQTSAEYAAHDDQNNAGVGSSEPMAGGGGPASDAAPEPDDVMADQNEAAEEQKNEDQRGTPALSTQRDSSDNRSENDRLEEKRSENDRSNKNSSSHTASTAPAADYVWSVYQLNGIEFDAGARESVPALFRACKAKGKINHASLPEIGDIVFFHNTVDLNQDGRNNDWYTHVAIVEAHAGEGKVDLLGYQGEKLRRFTMNLNQPDAAMDRHGGATNSQLRTPADDDAPFTQYLAGQLFAGTCSALGTRSDFIIVDNWRPGMDLSP